MNIQSSSSLPKGTWALAIAHPGHELRLHGFLELAKPFTFILTDGSEKTGVDMMSYSIKTIDRAVNRGIKLNQMQKMKNGIFQRVFNITTPIGDTHSHLKDEWIYHYVQNMNIDFLALFMDMIVKNLIKYNVNYLVCDASEDYHLSHEIVRVLSELACIKVESLTGKKIILYDYCVNIPPKVGIEGHLCLYLDEEALDRKIDAIIDYPDAIDQLTPFINCDMNVIMQIGKMEDGRDRIKNLLKELNIDFLQTETIYAVSEIQQTDNYKKFIEPIYGKLLQREVVKE